MYSIYIYTLYIYYIYTIYILYISKNIVRMCLKFTKVRSRHIVIIDGVVQRLAKNDVLVERWPWCIPTKIPAPCEVPTFEGF